MDDIKGANFEVNIYQGINLLLIIANDLDSNENFSVEISHDEVIEYMGSVDDYDFLIKHLGIDHGDLVLYDYRKSKYPWDIKMERLEKFKESRRLAPISNGDKNVDSGREKSLQFSY